MECWIRTPQTLRGTMSRGVMRYWLRSKFQRRTSNRSAVGGCFFDDFFSGLKWDGWPMVSCYAWHRYGRIGTRAFTQNLTGPLSWHPVAGTPRDTRNSDMIHYCWIEYLVRMSEYVKNTSTSFTFIVVSPQHFLWRNHWKPRSTSLVGDTDQSRGPSTRLRHLILRRLERLQ